MTKEKEDNKRKENEEHSTTNEKRIDKLEKR